MTKEQLAEIRARLAAATPGPWGVVDGATGEPTIKHLRQGSGYFTIAKVRSWDRVPENASFIAHAPDDLALALAEIERGWAEIERLTAAAVEPRAGVSAADPSDIADRLIEAVEDDNDGTFPATVRQRRALVAGVRRMLAAGCQFTDADVDAIAANESEDINDRFGLFDGFTEVDETLNDIFEGNYGPAPTRGNAETVTRSEDVDPIDTWIGGEPVPCAAPDITAITHDFRPGAQDGMPRLADVEAREVDGLRKAAKALLDMRDEMANEGGIVTGCSTAALLAFNAAAIDLREEVEKATPPRALTEAEAQEWAEQVQNATRGLDDGPTARTFARAILAASRGDVPPEVRPMPTCPGCWTGGEEPHARTKRCSGARPVPVADPPIRSDAGSDMTKREFIAHEAPEMAIATGEPFDPICACGARLSEHDAAGQYDPCPGGGGQFRDPPADVPSIAGPAGLDLASGPPDGYWDKGVAVERQGAAAPKLKMGRWISTEACDEIYDEVGLCAVGVSQTNTCYWWARRPFGPNAHGTEPNREKAKTAALDVLATWADVSAARGAQ